MVVEAFPEGSQSSFDLCSLMLVVYLASVAIPKTHLQLPYDRLAIIFRSDVCAQRDKKSTIHVFFLHAALTLFQSGLSLAFCASGLFLLPSLAHTLWLWLLLGSIPAEM